jgi:hypothetical protein
MFPELLGWQVKRAQPWQGKQALPLQPLEDAGIYFSVRRSVLLVGCI